MSLRSQLERHNITYFESLQEYAKDFCITSELMERKEFFYFFIQVQLIEILILLMKF